MHYKKTIIIIVIMIMNMLTLTSCGNKDGISGSYSDEVHGFRVDLKSNGKCTWTEKQDNTYEGTYEKEEDGSYTLYIKADEEVSAMSSDTEFILVPDDEGNFILKHPYIFFEYILTPVEDD